MALFPWPARRTALSRNNNDNSDSSALGTQLVALRVDSGALAPAGCVVVLFDAAGRARRSATLRVKHGVGETAWCFHPGPYRIDLTPFAQAPETALRLHFAIDAPDPRVVQQRFDLFLYCEAGSRLALDDFGAMLQAALRIELAQGNLELPPCTSLDEWNAFRAGLNQLFYLRFGVTVDDCVPVDLGDTVDFAALLVARVQVQTVPVPALTAASAPIAPAPQPPVSPPVRKAPDDAHAMRRLFLELPAACAALRLVALPAGPALFHTHRALLQRFELASTQVATMPSLAWAAPQQPLDRRQQQRRADATTAAVGALDETWAWLARLQLAGALQWPDLFDEAERILANLESHLARRRITLEPLIHTSETSLADQRREPT